MANLFGFIGLLFSLIWLIFFVVIIGSIVFWILMVVDLVKREFPKQDDKTMWLLIVVLTGTIGAIKLNGLKRI
jgi:TctA family transporter